MKRNWLTSLVASALWSASVASGGVFARASEPAYCVCPYFAEDFGDSHAYGSDWYLLGPESPGADEFLAALEAAEIENADEPESAGESSALPIENATCLFDKSTGENYARYLVEQVYKLYFAEKDRPANDAIVADPVDDQPLLCPAEQDYLGWQLDELAAREDEPVREALAAEEGRQRDRLELDPAPQPEYDWDSFDYDWTGEDDPFFAEEPAAEKVAASSNDDAEVADAEKRSSETDAEKDYARAERLSAFEEYAIWEETYGDCAEAAEAWAAVQAMEDEFANYWDNVVLSGSIYVAPKEVPASSVATIVVNGSPSVCTPTPKTTFVRNEDFAAPGQYVPTVREEESYPLATLAEYGKRLDLSDETVARIAASRTIEATSVSAMEAAAKPFLSFGETARRALRDLVLSDDERSALRQVASQSGKNALLR